MGSSRVSAIPRSMDADSKRWLTVLAVTAATSVVFMTYAFVKKLSPAEQSVVAPEKSTRAPAGEAATRSEPDWNAANASPGGQNSLAATTQADPFATQDAAAAKNDPAVFHQAVHQQAEYLRKLISEGKLPGGYGNLTKDQVDEMEKKGLLIE
jgi:hypothetical protein